MRIPNTNTPLVSIPQGGGTLMGGARRHSLALGAPMQSGTNATGFFNQSAENRKPLVDGFADVAAATQQITHKVLQEEAETQAMDAYARYGAEMDSLLNGENGILSLEGQAAFGAVGKAATALQETETRLKKGLSENAAKMFGERALALRAGVQNTVAAFEGSARRTARFEATKAAAALEYNLALKNPGNERIFAEAKQRALAAAQSLAEMNHLGPEQKADYLKKTDSDFCLGRGRAFLANSNMPQAFAVLQTAPLLPAAKAQLAEDLRQSGKQHLHMAIDAEPLAMRALFATAEHLFAAGLRQEAFPVEGQAQTGHPTAGKSLLPGQTQQSTQRSGSEGGGQEENAPGTPEFPSVPDIPPFLRDLMRNNLFTAEDFAELNSHAGRASNTLLIQKAFDTLSGLTPEEAKAMLASPEERARMGVDEIQAVQALEMRRAQWCAEQEQRENQRREDEGKTLSQASGLIFGTAETPANPAAAYAFIQGSALDEATKTPILAALTEGRTGKTNNSGSAQPFPGAASRVLSDIASGVPVHENDLTIAVLSSKLSPEEAATASKLLATMQKPEGKLYAPAFAALQKLTGLLAPEVPGAAAAPGTAPGAGVTPAAADGAAATPAVPGGAAAMPATSGGVITNSAIFGNTANDQDTYGDIPAAPGTVGGSSDASGPGARPGGNGRAQATLATAQPILLQMLDEAAANGPSALAKAVDPDNPDNAAGRAFRIALIQTGTLYADAGSGVVSDAGGVAGNGGEANNGASNDNNGLIDDESGAMRDAGSVVGDAMLPADGSTPGANATAAEPGREIPTGEGESGAWRSMGETTGKPPRRPEEDPYGGISTERTVSMELPDTVRGAVHGAVKGTNATLSLVHDMADWLRENGVGDNGYAEINLTGEGPLFTYHEGNVPKDKRMQVPNIGAPTTLAGNMVSGVSQFVVGFAGGGRLLSGVKTVARGGALIKGAVQGIIADFTAFDEHEARLSNLVQSYPELANPITEFLAAKADDGAAMGRFKNVVEGALLGSLASGATVAAKKAVSALADGMSRSVALLREVRGVRAAEEGAESALQKSGMAAEEGAALGAVEDAAVKDASQNTLGAGAEDAAIVKTTSHETGVTGLSKSNQKIMETLDWQKAKTGDLSHAHRIVDQVWTPKQTEMLKAKLTPGKETVFLAVPSTTRLNKIPVALGERLAGELGGQYVDVGKLYTVKAVEAMKDLPKSDRPFAPRSYMVLDADAVASLKGKQVVLTEDVLTTGSSARQFALELRRQGIPVHTVAGLMGNARLDAPPQLVHQLQRTLRNADMSIKGRDLADVLSAGEIEVIIERINKTGGAHERTQLTQKIQGVLDSRSAGPVEKYSR